LASGFLYLLFWPIPFKPAAFALAPAAPPVGKFAPNTALAGAQPFGDSGSTGPEAIAFDAEGRLYCGARNGDIVRFAPDGGGRERFANTGGRPLGVEFDRAGSLIVADMTAGLLSIDQAGHVTALAREAGGRPILFANDLAIAGDGTILFTDSSIYRELRMSRLDGRPHGRLLAYDPHDHTIRVLLEDLYLANGVTLGPDESFVLIAETLTCRITRYWLAGPKKGGREVFVDSLPGLPDNITWNGKDIYWLALFSMRDAEFDKAYASPLMRSILLRIPPSWDWLQLPAPNGYVLGLDVDGNVVQNLQDPTGKTVAGVTSVVEHNGYLYLGTAGNRPIRTLPAPSAASPTAIAPGAR
jgi:sugar lactone lactonase YvrE